MIEVLLTVQWRLLGLREIELSMLQWRVQLRLWLLLSRGRSCRR
jgi:hypothetical protein